MDVVNSIYGVCCRDVTRNFVIIDKKYNKMYRHNNLIRICRSGEEINEKITKITIYHGIMRPYDWQLMQY